MYGVRNQNQKDLKDLKDCIRKLASVDFHSVDESFPGKGEGLGSGIGSLSIISSGRERDKAKNKKWWIFAKALSY
jgi:hypothetical protein